MTDLAGILLCGGAARRFGADKALHEVEGEAMAARAWRLLGETCAERIAVGRPYPALGIEAVADSMPGAGPLAAIADGLERIGDSSPWAIVLPCDLPWFTAAAVRALAAARRPGLEAVVVEGEGGARPLPGLYARSAALAARRLLAAGRRSVRDLVAAVPHVAVPPSAWGDAAGRTLRDIDSPP